ncbi:DUF2630 family protein [Actinocorallia longicatena]|uniref:DUF2630 family protein n=2 Tax=Actinocorallia longicatena TaxID=111803 RepID=A0ABP6QI55_9ACTN
MGEDDQILHRIKAMIEEEHELRGVGGAQAAARVRRIEEDLDVCWDLLRQRRAAREFGADPEAAHPRSASEVEGYRQ